MLARWDPFRDLANVESAMERFFSDFGRMPMPMLRQQTGQEQEMALPTVDVLNRGDDLVIRAEMPGIKPEDVDVTVSDDQITIRGKRSEEHEMKQEDYLLKESTYGEFVRTMRLPQGVKPDDIKAEVHDGILEVTIPKGAQRVQAEPVRIPIGAGRPSEPEQGKEPEQQ